MSPACQLGPHATPMVMEGTSTGLGLCTCWSYSAGWTSHFQRITRGRRLSKKARIYMDLPWFTTQLLMRRSCNKSFKSIESKCIAMWASSRENMLGETFFHQSKGQRQKNGFESKFGTWSSRNPNSDVSIRVVGQTCTTWSHFSLHVGFYCWPYQAAVLNATLGTYPPCSLVSPP